MRPLRRLSKPFRPAGIQTDPSTRAADPNAVPLWACLVAALGAVILCLRDPGFPSAGLDASWLLSTDYAVRTGAVFGRDYVFTYGPYFRLAAPLFDPDRFGLVLVYDVVIAGLLCAPALMRRSLGGVLAVVATLLLVEPQADSLIMAALLAVFLAGLMKRNPWTCLLVALCGPLVLSKLSLLLVMAPLMLLADAMHAVRRRPPVFTVTLLASVLLSLAAAGQPLSALPDLARNSLSIILGYGHAMQIAGPAGEILAVLGLSALLLALSAAALAVQRGEQPFASQSSLAGLLAPAAALAGLIWTLFVGFKAGFVRQDGHPVITFELIVLGAAVMWGFASAPLREWRLRPAVLPLLAAIASVTVGGAYVARCYTLSPDQPPLVTAAKALKGTLVRTPKRLYIAADWLRGTRWARMEATRKAALASLVRPFPDTVKGTVDVIPHDLAEVIASGLDYHPRPVIQSYSAYTPALQRLDMAHFAGPSAPDTLLVKLEGIDNRLPAFDLGPSLPIIAARYDAVGTDTLGLILRKRQTPRAVSQRPLGEAALPINQWIDAPRSAGVVMAQFDVAPTLAGEIVGFVFRDPRLMIHLRSASGATRTYRFIPGMARIGVAVSPLVSAGGLGVLALLDPGQSDPVVALMIEARSWAYKPGKVRFSGLEIAAGQAGDLRRQLGLAADLALSDPTGGASLDGPEIFAPAKTVLTASIAKPLHIFGAIGVKAHPPGPPDDGVRFLIEATDAAGRKSTLLDRRMPPGPSAERYSVVAPAGAALTFTTDPAGNPNFDWSYWRVRTEAPAAE